MSFLETHQVTFVTIDIRANDIDGCISSSGIDQVCVETALTTIGTNLPTILTELRTVAGQNVPIIGMNYYDPFLAVWVLGASGQALAKVSEQVALVFNGVLETAYQAFSAPVADVASAFGITDFMIIPSINLPVNVFLTLRWTWMGAPPPLGPDIHPNAVGYAVIAGAFAKRIVP